MAYTPLLIIPLVGPYDSFDTSCLHEFGVKSTLDKRSRAFYCNHSMHEHGDKTWLAMGELNYAYKKIKIKL